jgi:hypothetical protein
LPSTTFFQIFNDAAAHRVTAYRSVQSQIWQNGPNSATFSGQQVVKSIKEVVGWFNRWIIEKYLRCINILILILYRKFIHGHLVMVCVKRKAVKGSNPLFLYFFTSQLAKVRIEFQVSQFIIIIIIKRNTRALWTYLIEYIKHYIN